MLNLFNSDSDFEVSRKLSIKSIESMQTLLLEALEEGRKTGRLINAQGFRGIGKTTALIQFAKQHGYAVIVSHPPESLRQKHQYKHIYKSIEDSRGHGEFNYVIDVFVSADENNLIGSGIVTGFTFDNLEKKPSLTFHGQVFKTLKNEISELTIKIEQARKNGEWGTYKNLIVSYGEILRLMETYIKGNKINE